MQFNQSQNQAIRHFAGVDLTSKDEINSLTVSDRAFRSRRRRQLNAANVALSVLRDENHLRVNRDRIARLIRQRDVRFERSATFNRR